MCEESPAGISSSSRELGADGEEDGVESALLSLAVDVVNGVVDLDVDAQGKNAFHLGIEDGSWKAVGGNAVAHHAAKLWRGVDELDLMTKAA